jgi:hypothetical protein
MSHRECMMAQPPVVATLDDQARLAGPSADWLFLQVRRRGQAGRACVWQLYRSVTGAAGSIPHGDEACCQHRGGGGNDKRQWLAGVKTQRWDPCSTPPWLAPCPSCNGWPRSPLRRRLLLLLLLPSPCRPTWCRYACMRVVAPMIATQCMITQGMPIVSPRSLVRGTCSISSVVLLSPSLSLSACRAGGAPGSRPIKTISGQRHYTRLAPQDFALLPLGPRKDGPSSTEEHICQCHMCNSMRDMCPEQGMLAVTWLHDHDGMAFLSSVLRMSAIVATASN